MKQKVSISIEEENLKDEEIKQINEAGGNKKYLQIK